MNPAIDLSDLHKKYGRHTAVDGLNLSIEPGSVFGLIGPNGAGKTTTLRMILDIIRPTSGAVRVLGEDPRTAGPSLRRRIGFIPGELRLEGRMTGRRMLDFYAEVSGPVRSGAIDQLSSRLGLDLTRPAHTLSKGNKQKLGIVQAFMHEPELLVLDEPTSGLDPLVQREFLQLVREARGRGQTVLLSSHVLSEIQQTADAVAVLSDGRIVAEGDVASLRLGAIRRVRAGFSGVGAEDLSAELARLAHVADIEITTSNDVVRLAATVEGDIDPFVKTIARHRLIDLAVEEPDLEESVLRLYGSAGSAAKEADRA